MSEQTATAGAAALTTDCPTDLGPLEYTVAPVMLSLTILGRPRHKCIGSILLFQDREGQEVAILSVVSGVANRTGRAEINCPVILGEGYCPVTEHGSSQKIRRRQTATCGRIKKS